MKRSSGVIIVDAENVSKELFQYAFSYIKYRKNPAFMMGILGARTKLSIDKCQPL